MSSKDLCFHSRLFVASPRLCCFSPGKWEQFAYPSMVIEVMSAWHLVGFVTGM